jgi:hypothetical protein
MGLKKVLVKWGREIGISDEVLRHSDIVIDYELGIKADVLHTMTLDMMDEACEMTNQILSDIIELFRERMEVGSKELKDILRLVNLYHILKCIEAGGRFDLELIHSYPLMFNPMVRSVFAEVEEEIRYDIGKIVADLSKSEP